jgi:hypothetical protein
MTTITVADRAVGVFDRLSDAEAAVADLLAAGFPQDRIEMITRKERRQEAWPRAAEENEAAAGAATGAAVGAGAGAIAGILAAGLIPGAGPVLSGAIAVGGGALGAAGGTFLGPFIAMEMSETEAKHYAQQVHEGRTVLVVRTTDRQEEANIILEDHSAHAGTPAEL